MRSIHQLVDTIVPGDAISNDCLQIQKYLTEKGYNSEIFVRNSLIRSNHIHHYSALPKAEDTGIIFHHSTFTPILEQLAALPHKKALLYHNITPAAFFNRYNFQLYKVFREAERQNYLLQNIDFDAVIGDSKYNLSLIQEYLEADYHDVLPPFLSLQFLENSSQNKITARKSNIFTILFVGRFAPNKRQDDIVKVFEYYSKYLNPNAELYLIGHYAYGDPYFNQLYTYIQDQGIPNIHIKANLSSEELCSIYQQADLLLSMSEHEGFCIPILESIHLDVPVLAYKIPALKELLDKKYLIDHKNYRKIAEQIYQLELDTTARRQMLQDQKQILDKFREDQIKRRFDHFINTVFHV